MEFGGRETETTTKIKRKWKWNDVFREIETEIKPANRELSDLILFILCKRAPQKKILRIRAPQKNMISQLKNCVTTLS
jgi:hypothetical protein